MARLGVGFAQIVTVIPAKAGTQLLTFPRVDPAPAGFPLSRE